MTDITVESIGRNETLVHTREKIIIVSYRTNVACYDKISGTLYRTDKFHSRTTDKHINKFMNMIYTNWIVYSVDIVNQSILDELTKIESLSNGHPVITIQDRRQEK